MATEAEKQMNMYGVRDISEWLDWVDEAVSVRCEGKIAGYRAVAFSILSDAQSEMSMGADHPEFYDRARQSINRAKYLLRAATENEVDAMENYIKTMGIGRDFPRRTV